MCINGFPEVHSDFSIYFSMSSSTSKSKQHTNCTHFQFFYPARTYTYTHLASVSQIDYRSVQRISATNPSISLLLTLAILPSPAERGVGMLSRPRQSEIQSYVTNRCQLLLQWGGGLKASENSLIRKDIAVTYPPVVPSLSFSFSICPSWISPFLFHRPAIFDQITQI